MAAHKRGFLYSLLLAATVLSGCLVPEGPPNFAELADYADPAGLQLGNNQAVIYATSTSGYNVPYSNWNIGSNQFSGIQGDALPDDRLGPYALHGRVWSPSMTLVNGNWVMWVTAVQSNGGLCLDSYAAIGYLVWTWQAQECGYLGARALDPSVFHGTDGSLWLLYSLQSSPGSGSEIVAQPLNSSGTDYGPGSAIDLVNYSDLVDVACTGSCQINGVSYGLGPSSYVENPQAAIDPDPTVLHTQNGDVTYGVNIFVSFGSWAYPTSYHTIEFACASLLYGQSNDNCVPGNGYGKDISGILEANNNPDNVYNPAGLSLLDPGASPRVATPYAFFAGSLGSASATPRYPWWEGSVAYHRN